MSPAGNEMLCNLTEGAEPVPAGCNRFQRLFWGGGGQAKLMTNESWWWLVCRVAYLNLSQRLCRTRWRLTKGPLFVLDKAGQESYLQLQKHKKKLPSLPHKRRPSDTIISCKQLPRSSYQHGGDEVKACGPNAHCLIPKSRSMWCQANFLHGTPRSTGFGTCK